MRISTFFSLLTLMYVTCAHAEDYRPACPATIDVQQSAQKVPDGWAAGISGGSAVNVKYILANVEFSSGDPAGLAWLVPDAGKKTRAEHTETWNFQSKASDGFWVSCEYTHTSVALIRRLPDTVKSCTVEYDTRFSDPVVKDVRCK